VKRLEYKGCLMRYQFTGAGWFTHWREMTTRNHAREGYVTATPEENLDTVLDLTRKEIDKAMTREKDCI
jgi:hypothetical protein